MAHVVIAELSQAGIRTLEFMLNRGHSVSVILSDALHYYRPNERFIALMEHVASVTKIPDTRVVAQLEKALAEVNNISRIDVVISQCDPMLEALAVACENLSLRFTSSK